MAGVDAAGNCRTRSSRSDACSTSRRFPRCPSSLRGRSFMVVESDYLGDEADGARSGRPAARARSGDRHCSRRCPRPALSHLHMDPEQPVAGQGRRNAARRAPAEAIDALVDAATGEAGVGAALGRGAPARRRDRPSRARARRPGGDRRPLRDVRGGRGADARAAGDRRCPGDGREGGPRSLECRVRLPQLRRAAGGHAALCTPGVHLPAPAGHQGRVRPVEHDPVQPPDRRAPIRRPGRIRDRSWAARRSSRRPAQWSAHGHHGPDRRRPRDVPRQRAAPARVRGLRGRRRGRGWRLGHRAGRRAGARSGPARRPTAGHRRLRGGHAGDAPGLATRGDPGLEPRQSCFGSLVEESGARGFVAKGDLSGDSLRALLDV